MNKLHNELMERKYSKEKLSVLYVDMDNFKQINDQWGHDAGDTVLKEVAERIQAIIGKKNFVARFGGDEFVVMLREVESEDSVIPIVRKLLKEFQVVVKQRHGTMKII